MLQTIDNFCSRIKRFQYTSKRDHRCTNFDLKVTDDEIITLWSDRTKHAVELEVAKIWYWNGDWKRKREGWRERKRAKEKSRESCYVEVHKKKIFIVLHPVRRKHCPKYILKKAPNQKLSGKILNTEKKYCQEKIRKKSEGIFPYWKTELLIANFMNRLLSTGVSS